jgi:hypothetical protein
MGGSDRGEEGKGGTGAHETGSQSVTTIDR